MVKLRNGKKVSDSRFDRMTHFDSRSKDFPVMAIDGNKKRKPRSYSWRCETFLDQGREGACVGFGIAHELAARPAEVKVTAEYAKKKIYWQAQKTDQWKGGSYPLAFPRYEGTSVLAGIKVVHKMGWMDSYRWAFGIDDLIIGLGHNGPAVLGLKWFEGMSKTDGRGYIKPSGKISGGHCILCKAVNVKEEYFILHNSWGRSWGLGGTCKVSFKDMDYLLHQEGEAAFFIKRRSKLMP